MKLPRLLQSGTASTADYLAQVLVPEGEKGALRITVDSTPGDERVHDYTAELARRSNVYDELVAWIKAYRAAIACRSYDGGCPLCQRAAELDAMLKQIGEA